MSEKSTYIIHPRDVKRCEICGDTIHHKFRGCVPKSITRPVEIPIDTKNRFEYIGSKR